MQRRGSSEQPAKGQSAIGPKARNAPTAQVSTADLQEQLDRRTRERDEALEQLAATSEVLRLIPISPGELKPVFEAMLANATRICEAKFGVLHRYENDAFHPMALLGVPPAFAEFIWQRGAFRPAAGTPLDRLLQTRDVVYTVDAAAKSTLNAPGTLSTPARLGGARSLVAVPMLKKNELVGAIVIYRQEVRPFTDRQIALLTNFASQAVIATENVRLLNELRQRTDDLSEALEQQTATAEVLKVISSSPGDLQPVFDAILANATDLCGARFASLRLSEGDEFRTVSLYNAPAASGRALAKHAPGSSASRIRPRPYGAFEAGGSNRRCHKGSSLQQAGSTCSGRR